MSRKLFALGNVLMGDDGIGIAAAKHLENILTEMGIEVIYGETDIGYCLTKVNPEDDIIILDGVCNNTFSGEVRFTDLRNNNFIHAKSSQHCFNLLDLLLLYFPKIHGIVITIEIKEVKFNYGISTELSEKFIEITNQILNIILSSMLVILK